MSTQAVIVYQSRAHEAMDNLLSSADAFPYMVAAVVLVAVFAALNEVLPQPKYNHKSKKMNYSDSARTGVALAVSLFGAICTVYFM